MTMRRAGRLHGRSAGAVELRRDPRPALAGAASVRGGWPLAARGT